MLDAKTGEYKVVNNTNRTRRARSIADEEMTVVETKEIESFEFLRVENYKTDYYIDTNIIEEDLHIQIKAINTLKDSKGDTYSNKSPIGLQIFVNEEEFALIDFYSARDRLFLNETFFNNLTQTQKDIVSGMMLAFYLTYKAEPGVNNSTGEITEIRDYQELVSEAVKNTVVDWYKERKNQKVTQ